MTYGHKKAVRNPHSIGSRQKELNNLHIFGSNTIISPIIPCWEPNLMTIEDSTQEYEKYNPFTKSIVHFYLLPIHFIT